MYTRFARFLASALMILGGSGPASAQMVDIDYERVLIPVVQFRPVSGAAGSVWATEFWMRNNASEPVSIYFYDYNLCAIGVCIPEQPPPPPTPPGISFQPILDGFPGVFLFVDRRHVSEVSFGLRALDLSRQSSTWGTEVPVVRESAFKTASFFLLAVPTSAGFRSSVRIYGKTWEPVDVIVRIRSLDANIRSPFPGEVRQDELLAERVVHLLPGSGPAASALYPSFAELTDLRAIPGVAGHDRVSIEVIPSPSGLAAWAFASIVHNESQHLTVVSPQ